MCSDENDGNTCVNGQDYCRYRGGYDGTIDSCRDSADEIACPGTLCERILTDLGYTRIDSDNVLIRFPDTPFGGITYETLSDLLTSLSGLVNKPAYIYAVPHYTGEGDSRTTDTGSKVLLSCLKWGQYTYHELRGFTSRLHAK